ncbi:MAG: UDP-N-acetylmuramate dehydrogenase [Deltaproteobacteria bacterium]|nr:UDP-N-acetylmuramate dehydrogenase [Deltaproteobacteria bacterium]
MAGQVPSLAPTATQRVALLYERLAAAAPPPALRRDVPLDRCTSFQIGGIADLLLDPPSLDVLASALAAARELEVPVTCLGGGTNVLVSDAGVRGLVVRLGKAFEFIRWTDLDHATAEVEVGAATRFIRLAKDSVARGFQGLEFAAGIPGSVGGAAQMNAGAFGGELSQCLKSLLLVTARGEIVEKSREELQFSYRKLALEAGDMIACLRFRLTRSSVGRLQQEVARVQDKRRRNQPVGYPNAGSIFKNPPGEYAGRLIEKAGLKGRTEGGAQVSPEHANFIVNLGSATARDVRNLMSLVQEEVWSRCGVWLEPEVRFIGEWDEAEAAGS